jgi:transketolase
MTTKPLPSLSSKKTMMLRHKSVLYRRTILEMIYKAKAGHTGGSLSCVDILNVLYNHVMNISPQNFAQVNRDQVHS